MTMNQNDTDADYFQFSNDRAGPDVLTELDAITLAELVEAKRQADLAQDA